MASGDRHIALYRVPFRTFTRIFQTGAMLHCIDGVPPDAVCVGAYIEQDKDTVILKFEHPWFDAVAEGCVIPMRNATLDIAQSPIRVII